MPTTAELECARNIRRQFSRRPIDSDLLEISILRGRVFLAGTLKTLREESEISLKEEISLITEWVMKNYPDVKQVICDAKLVQVEKDIKKVETGNKKKLKKNR